MEKIRLISDELKKTYRQKIYKLSLQSGCTCPNRDGTKGIGGCTFCSEGGSGDFAAPLQETADASTLSSDSVHYSDPASISNAVHCSDSAGLSNNVHYSDPVGLSNYVHYSDSTGLSNYVHYSDSAGLSNTVHCSDSADLSISSQIIYAKKLVDKKMPSNLKPEDRRYIAYFQSFTNTYGDIETLKALYIEVINRPEIVILSIGTRPDCISGEMLSLLAALNQIKPVWIELGLQTIHDKTAERINRCYTLSCYEETYRRLKAAGLTVITHVILGLPGETHEDMYKTVRYLAGLKPTLDGIKLQLLHILKGTRLYDEYLEKPFHIMSLEEYTEVLIKCIRLLPEETIIHRMTGDGPKKLLIEPKWSGDKKIVLNTINKALRDKGLL